MAINPGARKLIKGYPKTSGLLLPIATESTKKNNNEETMGDKRVCIQTIKNLRTSFLYKVHIPIQLIEPNLLVPILYFVISTIRSLITPK